MNLRLILLLAFLFQPGDRPLAPAWSPDHQILATTRVSERFVTPEGANCALLLNGRAVYPESKRSRWLSAYTNQHTFLSELKWSPDGQSIAFFEKVYNWEYSNPFNSDFEGWVTKKRYYLVTISRAGNAYGYPIERPPANPTVDWRGPFKVALDGRIFDLRADPPEPIH